VCSFEFEGPSARSIWKACSHLCNLTSRYTPHFPYILKKTVFLVAHSIETCSCDDAEMSSSEPAWQYRRRDEKKLNGPFEDDKILSLLTKPHFARQAKEWQVCTSE
jgi:hypothetical protein